MEYKIAPSLLAADFSRLGEEIVRVEPHVDMLHLDVMDGHFVPNVSFGIPVITSIRPISSLVFDCHIMATNPGAYLPALRTAGVDLVSVHIEAVTDPTDLAGRSRELGLRFGLVVSPPTPWAALEPFAELCDLLMVMSVNPGFGGQTFIRDVLEKVELARKWVDSHGLDTDIQVDGGVTIDTAPAARDAGANVFVAGTAVFGADDPVRAVSDLKRVIVGVA